MPEPIKLLKITHNYPRWKGDFAGPFVALLAKQLLNHNIQPVILAPHHAGAETEEVLDGVKVYRFRYARNDEDENLAYHGEMQKLVLGSVSGMFKFKNFLDRFRAAASDITKRENIDALAGHWLIPAGMVMKTVNKGKGLPTFMYSHGTDVRLMNKYKGVAYRYLRDFCLNLKRWTVVSSYLKKQMVSVDKRLESLIDVMPLPQDETIFYPDETVKRDANLVVAVTRFTEQKRVDRLLKAFALVVASFPEARLEIYGQGPLKSEMDKLIAALGIQHCVKINEPIRQEALRTVYNRAAMVVLNSVQEGFGLALSEAMLCGTAVIGAESGGITDIIEHEKRGLLVKPDNVERLAEAMNRLLRDKGLADQLARAGHQFALDNYTAAASAARYAEMIKRGIAEARSV